MATTETSIAWADRTWNPVRGCSRVSEGCRRCYAERVAARFSGEEEGYESNGPEGWVTTKREGSFHGFATMRPARWTGKVELIERALLAPLSWRKPARVFVNSMSDLFHEALPDEAIDRVFATMALAPRHTFQILTKRPERMRAYMGQAESGLTVRWGGGNPPVTRAQKIGDEVGGNTSVRWPLPNVWLGVSAEDQATADERIPLLLATPAAVRFVSAEPLLGPVQIARHMKASSDHHLRLSIEGALRNRSFDGFSDSGRDLTREEVQDELFRRHAAGEKFIGFGGCDGFSPQTGCPGHRNPRIDWVILGGESGPGARPCDVAWIRDIVRQCKAAGVPAFVKQDSGPKPGMQGRIPDEDWIKEFPCETR